MDTPRLTWDWGTGYDFFVSLYILHEPSEFRLRPSWAAGVRSRLLAEEREVLELAQTVVHFPLSWVYTLPGAKDSAAVIRSLQQMNPEERLPILAKSSGMPDKAYEQLEDVALRGTWSVKDRDALRDLFKEEKPSPPVRKLETMLTIWSDVEGFGDRFFSALQNYRQVFFAEEELRIQPALEIALSEAKQLVGCVDFVEFIEKISRGVRFEGGFQVQELILVPSYWITPLVVFDDLDENQGIFLFGGRPDRDSLVPGAQVPDSILRTLKTLADPTRLRILHYLSQETMSPAQLARKLRLRAPTVTHHLSALRLAGLVYLTLGGKKRKFYATRAEAISETFVALDEFLNERTKE